MTATLNASTVQANRAKLRSERSGTVLFVTAAEPEIVGSIANSYRSPVQMTVLAGDARLSLLGSVSCGAPETVGSCTGQSDMADDNMNGDSFH